ncbi:MAG: acyl-CoA dehydrogenase N-terminal domain-containing protein [Desulfobacterium sp.]
MTQAIADRKDVDFVLYEQFQAETLKQYPGYEEFNQKTIGMLLGEARNLAIKELLPTYTKGDRQGAVSADGKVSLPECLRQPFFFLCEICMPWTMPASVIRAEPWKIC